ILDSLKNIYTESQVDDLLDDKLDAADTLSLSNRINAKSDTGHTHVEADITNLDHYTDADIDGSESAFNGWDKDASDDYASSDFDTDFAAKDLDDLAEGTTNKHLTSTLKVSYDSAYAYYLKQYNINNIGVAGGQGFGVGVCPNPPTYMMPMTGCSDP